MDSYIEYIDRLTKQSNESLAAYKAESVKWCAENLKSDVYEIVDGKCVAKRVKNEEVVI